MIAECGRTLAIHVFYMCFSSQYQKINNLIVFSCDLGRLKDSLARAHLVISNITSVNTITITLIKIVSFESVAHFQRKPSKKASNVLSLKSNETNKTKSCNYYVSVNEASTRSNLARDITFFLGYIYI